MGILFLQETHSTKESENEFKKDFGKNNALHLGMVHQTHVELQ